MRDIVISIKPEYVEKILSGEKRFEFRKSFPSGKINFMYIYSTRPVKKVIGKAKIIKVLTGDLEEIWEKTKDNAGIDYNCFKNYYGNCNIAYAIEITDIVKFDNPKELKEFGLDNPPQSYRCIEGK